VTAPSSAVPLAVAGLPGLPQANGTRTASWPPTSRAASTTRLYWPGLRSFSGPLAPLNTSFCGPGARVAPLTPSAGKVMVRPALRHHWRMSFSHLVPWSSLESASYQTARVAAAEASGASTQMAT
jgi:hypothetical protein